MNGKLRWCVIGLIGLATVINYIDRNALAVMWPEVSKDIGATKEDYALLVTIFMIFYAFGQSLFGRIFDAIGTRMGFTISIVIWSLSIAAHALVRSLPLLGVLRATLGISEAGNWPGATKANALWFPSRERALAQGIFNAGASLGGIVSAPLIALLFVYFGWRGTFVFIGLLGFVWLVPWLWFYKADPEKHPGLSDTEREYILSGRTESGRDEGRRIPLGELLGYRQSWGVILARFFLDPVWWLFVSWLPIYLAETFGFDIKQIGLFAWVPFVGAMFGSLFGGWFAGRIIGAGGSVHKARTLAIGIGCAIMLPALLLTIRADDPLTAVLLIACILFGFQMAIGNIQTLPSDWFGGGAVGSLAGISGTAAVAGTLITTWLVPLLTKTSYAPIFALSAAIVPLAFLSFRLIGGRVEPVATTPINTQE
ncbi:MAG: MFS transporter [Sphingopyxis sp.]|uniref:MFS transporter n=1 Tax=Sphingopyxis sp. TaxID=1908224 RepID=UPI002ABC5D4F|nr:MFS transporter [Sphingopyxis sp.]MDZ3832718.1 MFS transporter [Sphingopyxis sp.]